MKVLYFHQFFNTPAEGGSLRSYYLSCELVKQGFEVHVITSHTAIHKKKISINGIHVTYLPISYDNSYGFWSRSKAYLKYAFWSILESTKYKSIDFCYVMTTPLTTGLIGLFNKLFLNRPFVFEVGDLWPLVPIEMGVLKNQQLSKWLYKFEAYCYRESAASIGLSPPITDYIKKVSPNTTVETVYNLSDCEFFRPSTASKELKQKYSIKDEFVITYTGTFGLANDLIRMIELIAHLEHLPIKFLFIGMGAEKEMIEQRTKALELKNCDILDFQKKEGMKEILAVSDAMLISFADYPSLFTGSPNKLFDALAAGLMVITNFDGWIKDLIEKENCGFSFIHDSASDFEDKIKPFLEKDSMVSAYKSKARALAEKNFSTAIQAKKQLHFLQSLFD